MKILLILVVAIAALVFYPLAVVWALNTLFGLGIAYTFKTWAAVIILTVLLADRSSK